jgi:hypothetical protein
MPFIPALPGGAFWHIFRKGPSLHSVANPLLKHDTRALSQKLFTKVKTNIIHQTKKSQIPSTKFQINLYCFQGAGRKFQYSMTETELRAMDAQCHRFGIWNFGHCYLFVIWNLGFGAFSFWLLCDLRNYASCS